MSHHTETTAKLEENAPVRRLTTDILLDIFYCAVLHDVDKINVKNCFDHFPGILSRVCSRWRAIVLSAPLLWRNVYLRACPDGIDAGIIDKTAEICPFGQLRLRLPSLSESYNMSQISAYTQPLTNLRTLDVESTLLQMRQLLVCLSPRIRLACVKRICLRVSYSRSDDSDPIVEPQDATVSQVEESEMYHVFKNVSVLVLACYRDVDRTRKLFRELPSIPWHQLTHLEVPVIEDDIMLNILRRCLLLRHLSYTTHTRHPIPSDLAFCPTLKSPFPPQLKTLTIRYGVSFKICSWSWSGLTELTIIHMSTFSLTVLMDVLDKTVHLKSLTITRILGPRTEKKETRRIHLEHLRYLSISGPDAWETNQILDYLTTPQLNELRLRACLHDPWIPLERFPFSPVQTFLERSSAKLHTFYCSCMLEDEDTKTIRSFLKALPSLQVFTTPNFRMTKRVLHEIMQGHLLPTLQALSVRTDSPSTFTNLVKTRIQRDLNREGFIRLKTAYGYFPKSLKKSVKEDVKIQKASAVLKELSATHARTDFKIVEGGDRFTRPASHGRLKRRYDWSQTKRLDNYDCYFDE